MNEQTKPTGNDQLLHQELDKVSLRYRRLLLWVGLGACWLVLAAAAAAVLTWARLTDRAVPGLVLVLMFALPLVLVPTLLAALNAVRNPFWIARRLEKRFMDLDERLLAAMEQAPDESSKQLGYLQQTVIGEAVTHAKTHRWESLVAGWKICGAQLGQFATLALFMLIAAVIFTDMRRRPSQDSWWTGGLADRGDRYAVKVEPEDTSIERGTSLLVLARFPERLPPDVQLIYRDAQGKEQQVPMSKSLDDPVFAGRVSSVNADLTYAVRYGEDETKWYKVSVFDYPNLEQADARLKFPEYTGAPEKLVEDTRSVTAVEGTEATLTFRLNKPVTDARLVAERPRTTQVTTEDPPPVQLARDPNDPTLYSAKVPMRTSQRYRLHLVDSDNRVNKEKPDMVLNVVPNRPPDVKLAFPGRDIDVSPLQEMNVRAQVWDDFGIKRVGMSYVLAGQEPKDVVLAEGIAPKEKKEVAHLVALEQLEAEPDQLLSYHLWVEDVAPDGSIRRTPGDMFFAEVRPFEEIYRQGQQPAAGEEQQQQQQQQQSQNEQQADEIAEQQKQIILATWKVMTRETSATPTAQLVPDVKTIGESQSALREQATGMEERLRDERSKGFLKNVLKHMEDAVEHLTAASDGPQIKSLAPALAAEQAAYAELLKLRAREHEVVRSQRQQRGQQQRSSRQQQRQQQLDQLDLNNEENRYETERQANPQQETGEQRETRQVLNRLRELAQRQEDLNRQMKELQHALQEARDQAQREELKRQLQRLRDQQQQNLRDTDELRDRMDSQENQQRMSDARQQLEESRENVRRASEALEKEMLPEAQSAGARASEQLNNLRDEFRKRTAGQFNDAMDRMRQDARELDQKQQEISQQLAEAAGDPAARQQQQQQREQPRTLRDSGERQQVAQDLQQQKERLEKLMEEMKRTVEEAENAEPLLSKQLYDTAREVKQQQPETALERTRDMLNRGIVEEARRYESDAGKAITRLREGVEQAAESVLGDEAEALRRARNELDALSQELDREIRRRTGGADQGDPTTRPSTGGDRLAQNAESRQGENGQPQPETPGEGQPGEQQQQRDGQRAQRGSRQGEQQQDGQQQPGEQGSQPSESAQANSEQEGQQQGQQQGGQQQGGQQQGGQRQQQASSQEQGQQRGQQGQRGQGQPGERQGEGQQQADAQQGDQQGEREGSQQARDGQQQQSRQARAGGGGLRQRGGADNEGGRRGGPDDLQRLLDNGTTGPGGNEELGPITGDNFRDWSDRLRDVEEMVGDPRLRAEAARIRERAREMRAEFNRHSREPNWDLVRDFVSRPLVELRDKVAEELLRKQGSEALVPIDREPVPPEFTEQVRRYYERLGSGQR